MEGGGQNFYLNQNTLKDFYLLKLNVPFRVEMIISFLLLILFFIFDNSHCTHGTSCINNPYHIWDRTQFIGEAKIQLYIGSVVKPYIDRTMYSVKCKKSQKNHIDHIQLML